MVTPLYNIAHDIHTDYGNAETCCTQATTLFQSINIQSSWNDYTAWITLLQGIYKLRDAIINIYGKCWTIFPKYRTVTAFTAISEYYYLYSTIDNGNGTLTDQPSGLTWRTMLDPFPLSYVDICNAWAKNSFRGRAETIAYIDRMRQLIWNEPFNVIWAARPEGG